MKRLLIIAVVSLMAGFITGVILGHRLPPTREQVASYLSNISVGELSEFTKQLNAQWGFQAFPQHLLPARPGSPAEPNK